MTRLAHTFGYQAVDEHEREQRIRSVFVAVARRYDLMNDVLSLGVHRLWKRTLVRMAAPAAGQRIVDLAGGTGDVASRMAAADRLVSVCDPSVSMMQAGQLRAHRHVHWMAGTAECMPLASSSIDTVTIAFGIRNVTRIEDALAEVRRVLKPGGRFLCLEFSTPAALVRPLYNFFSFKVIPRLGALIADAPEAYTYLVESIRRFPDQDSFKALIEQAGFADVGWRNLSLGIACIHVGHKAPGDAAEERHGR
jgi:demethylmenaquinone methyltransferase/2-methoxy-6-polyprenyl-1,4-benzoquinol methylase